MISSSPRRQTGTVHFALTKQPAPKVASGFSTTPPDLGAPIVPETRQLRNDGLHLRRRTRILSNREGNGYRPQWADCRDGPSQVNGQSRKKFHPPQNRSPRPDTVRAGRGDTPGPFCARSALAASRLEHLPVKSNTNPRPSKGWAFPASPRDGGTCQ